jgi:hypothetical protein
LSGIIKLLPPSRFSGGWKVNSPTLSIDGTYNPIINVRGLSKRYRVEQRQGHVSLRETLNSKFRISHWWNSVMAK